MSFLSASAAQRSLREMSFGNFLPTQKDEEPNILGSDLSAWIVWGRGVRDEFEINFTAGGHDLVYSFIPATEIWIDDAIMPAERNLMLLHELSERNLMAEGVSYEVAHARSNRLERWCRHHPEDILPQILSHSKGSQVACLR